MDGNFLHRLSRFSEGKKQKIKFLSANDTSACARLLKLFLSLLFGRLRHFGVLYWEDWVERERESALRDFTARGVPVVGHFVVGEPIDGRLVV